MPRRFDQHDPYDLRPHAEEEDWPSRRPGGNTFGFQRGRGATPVDRPLPVGWYGMPVFPGPAWRDDDRPPPEGGDYDRGYGRDLTYGPAMHWHDRPAGYGRDPGYGSGRGFLERAGDEVASWFGDEEAQRRREQDYRGIGPKGYVRSDDRVREDVCDRLSDHPMVDASGIEVTAASGEVTLAGSVSSRTARRAAEDCAERVSGVTHVQNNLRVNHSPDGPAGLPPRSTPL